MELGDRVRVKATGLTGEIQRFYTDLPGYVSVEVKLDYEGLVARYLVENLEVIGESKSH